MLFLVSIFAIFAELAFVRLFTTNVGGTAYFANLFLLTGIICIAAGFRAKKRTYQQILFPMTLIIPFGMIHYLTRFNLIATYPGEFFWFNVANLYPKPSDFDLQLAIYLLCFSMIPFMVVAGKTQGYYFRKEGLQAVGYLKMALGGILGALLFMIQNNYFPDMYVLSLFLLGGATGIGFMFSSNTIQKVLLVMFCVIIMLPLYSYSKHSIWSPYYRIQLVPIINNVAEDISVQAFDILVNGFFITRVNLKPSKRPIDLILNAVAPENKELLFIGSGTGENIAHALNMGFRKITAVEIEGKFVELSNRMHWAKPYKSPHVKLIIDDGRAFLTRDKHSYDLIFYSFVDSHTSSSSVARFRLDNFLYTVEGLSQAWKKINDDGMMMVSFATGTPWLRERLYHLMKEVTGGVVQVFRLPGIQTFYVIHKSKMRFKGDAPLIDITNQFNDSRHSLVPTDDSPFLYSLEKRIPDEHVRFLISMGLLFIVINQVLFPIDKTDQTLGKIRRDRQLIVFSFFSGSAFLFIELYSIGAMTPIWGSTFLSQSITIAIIIFLSYLGSLAGNFYKPDLRIGWILLLGLLLIAFFGRDLFHPFRGTLLSSRYLFSVVVLLPLFPAGFIYYRYWDECHPQNRQRMYSANLLGGAIGGLLECLVIVMGYRNVFYISMILYTFAFLSAYYYPISTASESRQPALENRCDKNSE